MKNEKIVEQGESQNKYEKIEKFGELFILLRSSRLDKEYESAYEEATELAKGFIDNKNKSSWQSADFEMNMKEKYPNIPEDFINALKRCVENYNPVVNIPAKPLW